MPWDDVIKQLSQPQAVGPQPSMRPAVLSRRAPIVIVGAAGAGKSRIFADITGKEVARTMSKKMDIGHSKKGLGREYLALVTIPGQPSTNRYSKMNHVFEELEVIEGVIFVGAYGYNHVWPRAREAAASALSAVDIQQLRSHNLRKEQRNIEQTCSSIMERVANRSLRGPRWILVAANKADLYDPNLPQARAYYSADRSSPFGWNIAELIDQAGASNLGFSAVPVSAEISAFEFSSSRGSVSVPSHWDDEKRNVSLRCLIQEVEGLVVS